MALVYYEIFLRPFRRYSNRESAPLRQIQLLYAHESRWKMLCESLPDPSLQNRHRCCYFSSSLTLLRYVCGHQLQMLYLYGYECHFGR